MRQALPSFTPCSLEFERKQREIAHDRYLVLRDQKSQSSQLSTHWKCRGTRFLRMLRGCRGTPGCRRRELVGSATGFGETLCGLSARRQETGAAGGLGSGSIRIRRSQTIDSGVWWFLIGPSRQRTPAGRVSGASALSVAGVQNWSIG